MILVTGIVLQKTEIIDLKDALSNLEILAESWWLPPIAVLIQIILYMLAFPGSLLMWTVGVIYTPWAATLIVTAGGLFGSLAAYYFASRMTDGAQRFQKTKVYKIMQKNSGFLQLCALRCLPGFPHSFINYSAGILKVRMIPFIISTTLGFAFKGFIYCSAIYSALHLDDQQPIITMSTLLPLIVLVLFSLLGVVIQKKYFQADTHKTSG